MSSTTLKVTPNSTETIKGLPETPKRDAPRVISKSNDPLQRRYRNAPKHAMILILIALLLLIGFLYHSETKIAKDHRQNRNNLVDYVLSNTTLDILVDTDTTLEGEFLVNSTYYEFSAEFSSLSFIQITNDPNAHRMGFTVVDYNESDPMFVLEHLHENGSVYSTEVTPDEPANITVIDMLMSSILVEHFIELSIKLGGAGYLGPNGQHIGDLHRFAQWMYRYKMKIISQMDHFSDDDLYTFEVMDNLTEDFEKVNAIVSASANAGHWVTSMEELVSYTSSEYTAPRSSSGRNLLESYYCNYIGMCDNTCYGMCGADCMCWSWVCGDCHCWDGCRQHDHWCSCKGLLEWCCINTFWIDCNGETDSECGDVPPDRY